MQMVVNQIKGLRTSLSNEKIAQSKIFEAIECFGFVREYRLDDHNIPDFFYDALAIEVKIKGQRTAIYKQMQRYCGFGQVQAIILITARSMGLPKEISGKPCFYINLTRAYL